MEIRNIKKSFGNKVILSNISFEAEEGKVTVILGESGCGKSTFLEIVSGNLLKDSGDIKFDKDIKNGISYIFQEDSLIPWKTVYENLEFVLKGKIPDKDLKEHIEDYLQSVNLLEYKDEYPQVLSGGMKRRVGIARAFSFPSNYLFMDEPFEFLDIKTKDEIVKFFIELQKKEKKTVLFVTHDIELAIKLGDKIVVFSKKPTMVEKILFNTSNIEELKNKIKKLFL